MSTFLDIATDAMRLIGAIGQGETPNASEAQNILRAANLMLDEWVLDRLTIFSIAYATYALQVAKASYTIGQDAVAGNGELNAPRPALIESAKIITSIGTEHELELPNSVEWGAIPDKNALGTLPLKLYCDYAFPIATLNFWPKPNAGGTQAGLYTWSQIAQFATLQDDINLPPGYAKAVKYNLAVNIYPEFPSNAGLDPMVVQIAQASRESIRKFNATKIPNSFPNADTSGAVPSRGVPQPAPAAPVQQ